MTKPFLLEAMTDKGGWQRRPGIWVSAFLALMALTAGCRTDPLFVPPPKPDGGKPAALIDPTNVTEFAASKDPVTNAADATNAGAPEAITLQAGDVLKISFPGSPNLNTTQPIRRDGVISLPLVGDVPAAGKTPKELQKDLIGLYATQLLSKEVNVEVQSSFFPIYVTGAVLHPGKIVSDRPLTAFDGIMEAGGFDYTKANLKKVAVIRQEGGQSRKYILNLKAVMDGKAGEPFYLKPGDTIYVPEKFTWF